MDKFKKISFFLSLIFFISCSSEDKNWYPFPNSFFGQTYTAGPIALTSNLNQINIWHNIKQVKYKPSKDVIHYAVRVPEVNIAWFFQDGAWPDKPNFQFQKLNPNYQESETSRQINLNGYTYDRIQEKSLSSKVFENKLNIGNAYYQILLITDLEHTSPSILKKILALENAGLNVIFIGDFPKRATGLSNFKNRDIEVIRYIEKISKVVYQINDSNNLTSILKDLNIYPLINLLDKDANYFRSAIRSCGEHKIIYFF